MLTYYRGKLTYTELKSMPIGDFIGFYYLFYKKSLTKEGQNEIASEQTLSMIGDAGL